MSQVQITNKTDNFIFAFARCVRRILDLQLY